LARNQAAIEKANIQSAANQSELNALRGGYHDSHFLDVQEKDKYGNAVDGLAEKFKKEQAAMAKFDEAMQQMNKAGMSAIEKRYGKEVTGSDYWEKKREEDARAAGDKASEEATKKTTEHLENLWNRRDGEPTSDEEEEPVPQKKRSKAPTELDMAILESLASGGSVPGMGDGTKDTVPAMLAPGEFVINAKQAQKNIGLLSRINAGDDNVQRLALGGMVLNNVFSPVIPSPAGARRMADGGVVASFNNTFNVGGGNYNTMMKEIGGYLSKQWEYPYGGTGRRAVI